jgi:hypothetical protein
MDQNRILELALQMLEKQKAGIEAELEMIRSELTGKGSTIREKKAATPAGTQRGRRRTPAERKAHSEAMRKYWAAKRGKAAKVAAAPKTSPAAGPKRKAKTAAEKKALSLKMKQVWAKRRAEAA